MILEKLQARQGFSKTENAIADWLLAHGDEVRNSPIDMLAEASGSSPATIVRLCRKIGVSGYREFRITFNAEIERAMRTVAVDANMPFSRDDSREQVAWKLGNLVANAINRAISGFDFRDIDRVVEWLVSADEVNVFTVGTSVPAGLDFKTKLMRIGKQINIDQDAFLQRGYAISASHKSCNLLISQSGETPMIVDYARILRSRGCHTVAITSNIESRLSRMCNVVISTNTCESDSFSSKLETFASFDATHFILDCLYCWIFQADYDTNTLHAREAQELLTRFTSDAR
jgi:DNA-binding MurR/RpiR family transcriptional regulator